MTDGLLAEVDTQTIKLLDEATGLDADTEQGIIQLVRATAGHVFNETLDRAHALTVAEQTAVRYIDAAVGSENSGLCYCKDFHKPHPHHGPAIVRRPGGVNRAFTR